jgi:hypothetical protein
MFKYKSSDARRSFITPFNMLDGETVSACGILMGKFVVNGKSEDRRGSKRG